MSDAQVRELERRWRASGSVADEAAWLAALVRAGALPAARLEAAAVCGYAPALEARAPWELSHAEAAAVLGVPESALETWLHEGAPGSGERCDPLRLLRWQGPRAWPPGAGVLEATLGLLHRLDPLLALRAAHAAAGETTLLLRDDWGAWRAERAGVLLEAVATWFERPRSRRAVEAAAASLPGDDPANSATLQRSLAALRCLAQATRAPAEPRWAMGVIAGVASALYPGAGTRPAVERLLLDRIADGLLPWALGRAPTPPSGDPRARWRVEVETGDARGEVMEVYYDVTWTVWDERERRPVHTASGQRWTFPRDEDYGATSVTISSDGAWVFERQASGAVRFVPLPP